jgi:hypothetical protein
VGGSTESEQSDSIARFDTRHSQAPEPDDARAKQRRCMQEIEILGQRKYEIGARHSEFTVATID